MSHCLQRRLLGKKIKFSEHTLCHPAQGLRTPRIRHWSGLLGAIYHVQTLSDPKGMGRMAHLGSMNRLKSLVLLWEPRQGAHILFNIHSRFLDTCRRRQHSAHQDTDQFTAKARGRCWLSTPPAFHRAAVTWVLPSHFQH